ncbi:MAG TPA: nuclear transport factor 2 family protein [Candidatus Limnocylindrales bacterium]
MESALTIDTARRQLIADHFAAAGKDEAAAAEIFADDAVLEWPQSGERIRGKSRIIALHQAAPVAIDFDVRRTIGGGDLWVTEATIRYDGERPTNAVMIMEFRGGTVVRETSYFGEPFEPPAYRSSWVELMTEGER